MRVKIAAVRGVVVDESVQISESATGLVDIGDARTPVAATKPLTIQVSTRNMFCGTWYLTHSKVHNDGTVPIKRLYFIFFIAHTRNGHISTSCVKSNVSIVFLDPDFH